MHIAILFQFNHEVQPAAETGVEGDVTNVLLPFVGYISAFIAWSWDAFDFFSVSLTVSNLAADFGKSNTDITWGITLVLMFRSVGSILFGVAADRYGMSAL